MWHVLIKNKLLFFLNLCLILEVWLSVFMIWKFYNLLSYIWSVHRLRSENLGALRLLCGRRIRMRVNLYVFMCWKVDNYKAKVDFLKPQRFFLSLFVLNLRLFSEREKINKSISEIINKSNQCSTLCQAFSEEGFHIKSR